MSYKRVNKTKTPTKGRKKKDPLSYTPQIKPYKNMWNPPTLKQLQLIPELYATENIPPEKKKVYMKFFIGGWTWYITEIDHKNFDTAFGYVVSPYEREWGYVSLKELDGVKKDFMRVDRDTYVNPRSPKNINDQLKIDGHKPIVPLVTKHRT